MVEGKGYLRLPGMAQGTAPVRVGIILPFSNGSPATRRLAESMMNAAELALYDSGKRNIVLMTGDEGGGGAEAEAAARGLISKGAEIIIGPLFAGSVRAVQPVASARGIPVIAFSTDRSAGGNGVYLLSFQPENEIRRVVSYAASQGRTAFAALIPNTPYGDHIANAFSQDVPAASGHVVAIQRFDPVSGDVVPQANAIAQAHPDTVVVAQGMPLLRSISPTLSIAGIAEPRVQLLGPGLWDDPSIAGDPGLVGGWFAAPAPTADDAFMNHYQETFGEKAPQLTTLSYDAVALIALLSDGQPGQRFSAAALTNPNGFSGVTGIFRFDVNGDCERGLAILGIGQTGIDVISPAPTTFEKQGS